MKKLLVVASVLFFSGCVALGNAITEEDTLPVKNVEKIKIESSSADIKVIEENREDILVRFDTRENGAYLRTKKGETTYIEIVSPMNGFRVGNQNKLTVYVPESYEGDVDIENSSGDVWMEKLNVEELAVEVSSGDIELKEIENKKMKLEVKSGDIQVVEAKTTSLEIDTTSGDVHIDKFMGEIMGNTTSGDVEISYAKEMNNLQYATTSGDIKVNYGKVPIDGIFEMSVISGDMDMNVTMNTVEKQDEKNIRGSIGNGTYKVILNASSGDIEINEK